MICDTHVCVCVSVCVVCVNFVCLNIFFRQLLCQILWQVQTMRNLDRCVEAESITEQNQEYKFWKYLKKHTNF